MTNLLNTSINKTTYGLFATAVFVFLAALSNQLHWTISPELWAAGQGLVQAGLTFLIPNKETP